MSYTIEELQGKSDHEIGVLTTIKIYDCEQWCLSGDETSFYHCGIDGNGYYEIPVINIKSWADIGSITSSNKITTHYYRKPRGECGSVGFCSTYNPGVRGEVSRFKEGGENRAAAIVYLMMD